MLSVLSEKNVIPPYGVAGGGNGAANRFVVVRNGRVIQPSDVPGKVSGFALQAGDLVREETAGGGGFGDPLIRDPELVAEDVRLDYLTAEQAGARYGVVFESDGAVDAVSTSARRLNLASERVTATLEISNEDDIDGPRRRISVPSALANDLNIVDGDLVELRGKAVAPLRGWARVEDSANSIISLGPTGMRLLGADPGDQLEIRAVQTAPEGVV
jgi:N-methylhydantoinase B